MSKQKKKTKRKYNPNKSNMIISQAMLKRDVLNILAASKGIEDPNDLSEDDKNLARYMTDVLIVNKDMTILECSMMLTLQSYFKEEPNSAIDVTDKDLNQLIDEFKNTGTVFSKEALLAEIKEYYIVNYIKDSEISD